MRDATTFTLADLFTLELFIRIVAEKGALLLKMTSELLKGCPIETIAVRTYLGMFFFCDLYAVVKSRETWLKLKAAPRASFTSKTCEILI